MFISFDMKGIIMINPIKVTWENFLKDFNIKSTLKTAYKELNICLLADLFSELENLNNSVKKIFLNPKTFSVVRSWRKNFYDHETDQKKIEEGIYGYIWGATFIASTSVPDFTVLIVSNSGEGALLLLNEDIPGGAGDLIEMHDRLQQMSSEIQSLMRKASDLIEKIVTRVEKIN